MQPTRPNYLLFAATTRQPCQPGGWRFVLEPIGPGERLIAADAEPATERNRLELLAVVRGLEALEQPSQIMLLTRSRYVRRGIDHDLVHWREANWRWECFGKLVPVRDLDLWQRVDRALGIHQIACLRWQWDELAHELQETEVLSPPAVPAACPVSGAEAAALRQVIPPRRNARSGRRIRLGGRPSPSGVGRWGTRVLAAMSAPTRHLEHLVGARCPRSALSRTA